MRWSEFAEAEPRLAALILFNGVYDVYDSVIAQVPSPLRVLFRRDAGVVNALLTLTSGRTLLWLDGWSGCRSRFKRYDSGP